jgi:hypothetical protein
VSCLLVLVLLADPPMIAWTAQPGVSFIDVENIGDINGDGTEDIVAAPNGAAALYCLDGMTGEAIWINTQTPGILMSGAIRALPDVNGDGHKDIAVGGSDGTTSVFSGLDGNLIWSRQSEWPVHAVNYSTGSSSTIPIIHSTLWSISGYTYFLALDGLAGDSLWRYQTWTDDRQVSVISDFSGNNWDEISICHDRGYVYSGFCEVIDGLTGQSLYSTSTIYFGAMDVTDTPLFILASYSWGGDTTIRAEDMVSSDTLYTIAQGLIEPDTLKFVTGVTGGSINFPILMGWSSFSPDLYLISGLNGNLGIPISYNSPIVLPMAFQESDISWKLAVLTQESLYLTEPSEGATPAGPSCNLPAAPGRDMCLFSSEDYPTKLAAVAISGTAGPGLCAIATSWPTETGEVYNQAISTGIDVLCNPGFGGVTVQNALTPETYLVIDIVGRLVEVVHLSGAEVRFIPLPVGVYHIVNTDDNRCKSRAIVISN